MSAPPFDPDEMAALAGRSTHPGFHYVWRAESRNKWRPARDWRDRPLQCRWTDHGERCPNSGKVALDRARPIAPNDKRSVWWWYCADHLYSRMLHDGTVWSLILVSDSVASRG